MIEEVINILDVAEKGDYENNAFVVPFSDSKEYSHMYSVLSANEEIKLVDDKSLLNEHAAFLYFEDDSTIIKLIADFDADTYKMVVEDK